MKRLRVVLRIFEESEKVKRIPRRSTEPILDFPTYTIPEAALFLAVPTSTLRYWLRNHPLWQIAGRDDRYSLLSFRDLAQAYYVEMARKHFDLTLVEMRDVLEEAPKESRSEYPLLQKNIRIFKKHVILDKAKSRKQPRRVIDLSRSRQLGFPDIYIPMSTRIVWQQGHPVQLFPWRFWTGKAQDKARPVSITPEVMSGRLVITGTRIPVQVVLQRNLDGETVSQIAKDYRLPTSSINRAIEHLVQKAA